MAERLIG